MSNHTPSLPGYAPLKRALKRIGATARALMESRQGAIGIAAGLLFVPAVMITGAAVDYARLEQFKTQLQATVDSAALSGAAAYVTAADNSNAQTVAANYVTSNENMLPSHIGTISSSAVAAQVASGSNQGYTVTVNATGTIGTTFMRMVSPTLTVSAKATAVNPLVTITINASNFNSSAADFNTLWYWLLSSSSPNSQPSTSQFTSSSGYKLGCNSGCSNTSVTFTATATQKIAMALENVTGGLSDYGCNQYQTAPGQWESVQSGSGWHTTYTQQWVTSSCKGETQWFFSNMMPPSANTDNSNSVDTGYQIATNCSLQVQVATQSPSNTTPPVSGQCFSSLPQYATPSCAQLNGEYGNFYWNDMGGNTDDKDYNDAEISISCSGVSGSGNSATSVYLSS